MVPKGILPGDGDQPALLPHAGVAAVFAVCAGLPILTEVMGVKLSCQVLLCARVASASGVGAQLGW